MTKHEKKLKSMLNYFEVDLTGIKDEKLNKEQLKSFLDRFNQFIDYYIFSKVFIYLLRCLARRCLPPLVSPPDVSPPAELTASGAFLFFL